MLRPRHRLRPHSLPRRPSPAVRRQATPLHESPTLSGQRQQLAPHLWDKPPHSTADRRPERTPRTTDKHRVTAQHYARWVGGAYRRPMEVLDGEHPADLMARLAA